MTEAKWWDVTIPMDRIDQKTLINLLDGWDIERYVVGREKGESGYEHYQCRMVFNKGKNRNELSFVIPFGHWTPTKVRNFEYVEKEGNFIRSWEKGLRRFQEADYRPWQVQMNSVLAQQSDREIYVLVDEEGGAGKTFYGMMLQARHEMEYIPSMEKAKEYMHVAYAKSNDSTKGFFIDITCETDVVGKFDAKWQNTLFSSCEKMKNGHLYDGRNSWKEKYINPPKILIAMNQYPEQGHLSKDRLKVFHLEKGKDGEYFLVWDEWAPTWGMRPNATA